MELGTEQVVEGCIAILEVARTELDSIKSNSGDSGLDPISLDNPASRIQDVIIRLKRLLEKPKSTPALGSGTALACDDRQEDRSSC